jgi:hypothetical protein
MGLLRGTTRVIEEYHGVLEGYLGGTHGVIRYSSGTTAGIPVARWGLAVIIARPATGMRPRVRVCVRALGRCRMR